MTTNNKKILGWLEEYGVELSSDKTPGADWVMTGIFMEMTFNVLKPEGVDCVQLQRVIEISKEHLGRVQALDESEYSNFIYKLKTGFLQMNVRYQLMPPNEQMTGLFLTNRVYEDGLTQDRLMNSLYMLHDASILFIVELNNL